jgi:hypothetical protein
MLRGSLVALIYDKTLYLSCDKLHDSAPLTLMSTDIDGLTTGVQNLHDIWADFIQIGVGVYLLERQVGVSCFFVIILTVGMFMACARGKFSVDNSIKMHPVDDTHLKRHGRQYDGMEHRGTDESLFHVSCAQADQSHQVH